MYRYLELLDENLIIRRNIDSPKLERYDATLKEWVPDWDLSEVFTGDVRTRLLTEAEVWERLSLQRE